MKHAQSDSMAKGYDQAMIKSIQIKLEVIHKENQEDIGN